MAPAWQEVDHARVEKRCELVLSGPAISKRIEEADLDASVFTLSHLNFLEVSNTCLSTIPDGIARLVNLTRLVLSANQLAKLPADLGKLRKLKFLDVSRNRIEDLPIEISNLTELQSLIVAGNQLRSLPAEFSKLNRLIVLNFSNNQVEEFPSFLTESRFDFLTELVANNNRIEALPAKVAATLPSLKTLDVANNAVKLVPGEVGDCAKLKEIHLKENPLSDKRLKKLVEQCHHKQVLEYVKGHGPREAVSVQGQGKSGGAKKGGKKKGPASSTDLQEVLSTFEVLQLSPHSPVVVVTEAVQEVRPYIVCCIIRGVFLDRDSRLRKFLALQNKLHDTICVKRSEATIATHDLSKITGNVLYDAKDPDKLRLVPLGRKEKMSGRELYRQMTEEADALRKEKKRSTYPGIYKFLYLLKDKTLYPYVSDGAKVVMSFPPITNSEGTRISEDTKDVFCEVTGSNLPFCKKVMDALLTESLRLGLGDEEVHQDEGSGEVIHRMAVEKVKVVDREGNLRVVYPSKTDLLCDGISVEQRPE
ncbi:hypothetical protein HPB47_011901 [Ixodes persulcatus]|uniref:Uncharacterized protein n=1 Tax=Ixodes persulcatus TaxID=34615 RepID=A0AC60NV57_IXOPE|nr:hypothetical protein HPB47_011901 [Ixodes persulcatus]